MNPNNLLRDALKVTVENQRRYRPIHDIWPWAIPAATVAFIILMAGVRNHLVYAAVGAVIAQCIKLSLTTLV